LGYLADNTGAVVAALAALLAAGVALYIRRRNSTDAARALFRAAFTPELSALRELHITEYGQVFERLRAAYPRHEAAYMEYSTNLGLGIKRLCLRHRWMKYRGPYPKAPELATEDHRYRLAHFIGSGNTLDREEEKRNDAIALLSKLIA
jgi:hypothetical protein